MQVPIEFFALGEKENPLLCDARQIGSRAGALLARPGFSGKVLAVLSKTVYLVSNDGEILWMSRDPLAMHRRCILASFRARSIRPGQTFFVDGPFLHFPEGKTIDLDPATEWEPSGVGPAHAEPLRVVRMCIRRLVKAVTSLEDPKGFGQRIPALSSLADGNEQAISNTDPLLARVQDSIFALAAACFNLDMEEVARKGRELIGLGPGLTPSGDDFLGGLLFAAHGLREAYPQDFNWKQEPVMNLIHWASTQTHPISHVILSDHACGHGPKPLHDVVASLLKGEDLDRTFEGTGRLLEIGETSGWDILAGMLTGMLLVEGKLGRLPA